MNQEKSLLKLTTVLFRTMQHVERVIKKDILSYKLNTSEFGTLELLYNRGAQPMQMIASKLLMANSSMTYVIDQLEEKQMIQRFQDENDRRMIMVDLTDQGRAFFNLIFPKHVKTLHGMYQDLSQDELQILIELLKKVGYKAKELQEHV